MSNQNLPDHIVYSPKVIEFVTVVAETCLLCENASGLTKTDLIQKSSSVLALLYLKALLIEKPEPVFDDQTERFVTEEDYLYVKEQYEQLLGADDSYLEVFHPDMAMSDTPIAAFISEDMADIYQEIKDFAANYQTMETDLMNDALLACLEAFEAHWGRKTLNAMKALHALRYQDITEEEEEDTVRAKVNRNTFMNFLNDDENEINNQNIL